jgi:hypothetical protein
MLKRLFSYSMYIGRNDLLTFQLFVLYSENKKRNAMLKLGDLKQGDIVFLNDEGVQREGTVVKISHEEHQALINNGVQEFWYTLDEIKPIPLDENQLLRLGFTKEEMNGSSVKEGDFSNIEMWWREDRRHFNFPLGVHDLQNLHLDMTKVPLEMH